MHEQFFQCPYCWQTISVLVDLSVREQSYIEDCENCCNPIQFEIITENQEILSFDSLKMD